MYSFDNVGADGSGIIAAVIVVVVVVVVPVITWLQTFRPTLHRSTCLVTISPGDEFQSKGMTTISYTFLHTKSKFRFSNFISPPSWRLNSGHPISDHKVPRRFAAGSVKKIRLHIWRHVAQDISCAECPVSLQSPVLHLWILPHSASASLLWFSQ